MYKSNSGLGLNSNRFAFLYVSCYSKVAAFKSATALILTVVKHLEQNMFLMNPN